MMLQISILNEKVKKSSYVTGEHLEGLLSCVTSQGRISFTKRYSGPSKSFTKKTGKKLEKKFRYRYGNVHFEPYVQYTEV